MAVAALVATVGSASANTYATETEARTYFDSRLDGTAWPVDDAEKCQRALLTAMRVLEVFHFIGWRVDTTQALEWPRVASSRHEREWRNDGEEVHTLGGLVDKRKRLWSATEIPQPLKDAQCEIALAMILDDALNSPIAIQQVLKSDRQMVDRTKPAMTRLRMAVELLQPLINHGTKLVLS